MFKGCGTALVTPFRSDQSLDEESLRKLVRRQIEGGIDFLVPCGTTGENPTLSREEHLRVVEITIGEARSARIPVLAGAGGYNTHEVIELARACEKLGADGVLSVTPYYNKPTQDGLVEHYSAIAAAVSVPIVVYSVAGRTGVNVEPATMDRLAKVRGIAGVKEASGNLAQIASILQRVPGSFTVLSGDDAITIGVMALGGRGLVSVASNLIPREMTELVHCCLEGNFAKARELQRQWLPLMEVNFVESNPMPVKWALARMGLIEPVYRLPMIPPKRENQTRIEQVLESAGLLERAAAGRTR